MAYCRTALLVRLTLGLCLCLAQCLSISAFDDPASQDLRQRARLLLSEEAKAVATHGMTATSVVTTGSSVASAIGSAAASAVVASRRARSVGWLHSSGGSRRRTERGSSSSTKSVGAGVGGGRKAFSLLTPAVAPRAGTSALFVVSTAGPSGASPRARETYLSEADRARCRCVVRVCVWCACSIPSILGSVHLFQVCYVHTRLCVVFR